MNNKEKGFQGLMDAEEEEKINVIEFIKSMDQIKIADLEKLPLSELKQIKNETKKEMNGPRKFLQRKSREESPSNNSTQSEDPNSTVWRKHSAEVKTSLRKMAFKNHRQETFHSLAMCSDNGGDNMCMETANSSSAASLNEDFMRMPYVEAGRVSTNGRSLDSAPSPPNPTQTKSVNNGNRRVLHTIEQPDGSTIAFCTEIETQTTKTDEKQK
ncbi:unnamed protein product [Bursaphelenchus okinawaensis]|uniref:Uncharacterized protein n=1 Tax=Bursaphelenchus okinawaensis TaxID=465554 RepID=A0A811L8D2_9BILA|nr:unnamed protein product [Bursaphelenchus okinawaensis]CAG9117758.1 unnamed protein product [Bursaphelenchus okinawaensis]